MEHQDLDRLLELARQDHGLLRPVYREIADELGMETALEMYALFRGQQISFPVRFYDPDDVRSRVLEEYDGTNIRRLAAKYGYSEKTIRRMLK